MSATVIGIMSKQRILSEEELIAETNRIAALSPEQRIKHLEERAAAMFELGHPHASRFAQDVNAVKLEHALQAEAALRAKAERAARYEHALQNPPVDFEKTEHARRGAWLTVFARDSDQRSWINQYLSIPVTGWPPDWPADERVVHAADTEEMIALRREFESEPPPVETGDSSLVRQARAMGFDI